MKLIITGQPEKINALLVGRHKKITSLHVVSHETSVKSYYWLIWTQPPSSMDPHPTANLNDNAFSAIVVTMFRTFALESFLKLDLFEFYLIPLSKD